MTTCHIFSLYSSLMLERISERKEHSKDDLSQVRNTWTQLWSGFEGLCNILTQTPPILVCFAIIFTIIIWFFKFPSILFTSTWWTFLFCVPASSCHLLSLWSTLEICRMKVAIHSKTLIINMGDSEFAFITDNQHVQSN